MPSVTLLLRRARARLLSRPLVASGSAQRRRQRKSPPEAEDPAVMALPDDMLIEVFKRLPPLKNTIRCAAVCRRWRRVISSGARAGWLPPPPPPRHLGFFFRSDRSRRLPRFVATKAGVNLDVRGSLPLMASLRGARIVDGRGGVLVLHEGRSSMRKSRKLKLILCNPLERSFRRLPTVNATGYQKFRAAFVPVQGAGGFRVAVVLFGYGDDDLWRRYAVLIYDSGSASSGWKMTSASRRRGDRHYIPIQGPSVVVGDVVYSLLNGDVMAVDTAEMTMSVLSSPVAHDNWYERHNWIGKTDDGRPCYFSLDRSKVFHLDLESWALVGADHSKHWTPQQTLRLPREFCEISSFGKHLGFARFCEGSMMLLFVINECVVSFDIQTLELETLSYDPWWLRRPTGEVYPYTITWPQVLKDFDH